MSSFADLLREASESASAPGLHVGLTDGNRVSLSNWRLAQDCLVEYGPKGRLRQLIPFAQIALVEFRE